MQFLGTIKKIQSKRLFLLSTALYSNIMNNIKNPLQVLKTKSKEAWSGCIEFEEPKDASVSWHVYLLEGKIQYVNTTVGQQTRLNYLWHRFKLGSGCPELEKQKISEYTQLCQCLSDKQLTAADIKKYLHGFVREGLTQVLSIQETNITFIPTRRITKSIISFNLEQLKSAERIKAWQKIRSYLGSPFSRLYLEQKNALQFYKIWKTLYTNPELASLAKRQRLSSFASLFVAKSSLYELATKANVNLHLLAVNLKQSIAENIVTILPFQELTVDTTSKNIVNKVTSQENNTNKNPKNLVLHQASTPNNNLPTLIVCIDDSKTVQRQVKMTLEAVGYQVMGITEPTMTLKELSQQKPAVIFMDINMPDINGYDLCSLLRKSKKFKEIPIVMLTGRDGMIDRVRAKLVGATDYLTKPCDPNKLIQLTKALEKSVVTAQ